MKVLLVCRENIPNPYVKTLAEGIASCGVDVVASCSKLWGDDHYDIVHFQWPEAVFDWKSSVTKQEIEMLTQKLDSLKKEGTKIIITCHNLCPHTYKDKGILFLYELIYRYCDMFVHMGNYSYVLLSKQFPNAIHIIIPHHIYNTKYIFDKDRLSCQHELGLDSNNFIILCFGEFRSDEERNFVIKLNNAAPKDWRFVSPGFYMKRFFSRNIKEIPERIFRRLKYKINGFGCPVNYVDDYMLEVYFSACDIVMIQRHSILNSGNLPMAFYAGKVVVGPDCGNVGQILKETGNPVFAPWSIDSALKAICVAKELSGLDFGEKNRKYALSHWATELVASNLFSSYNWLLNNR